MRWLTLVALMAYPLVVIDATAQFGPPAGTPWQKLRDAQPAKLHLKLTLPKDHFFLGEKIDATLEFSNDDAGHPYMLLIGAGQPGGAFEATDAKGNPCVNPLEWFYNWHGFYGEGPVAEHPIGHYTLTIPVNDTVRFDAPGTYTLFACSRLGEGPIGTQHESVGVVSNQVVITITAITPDQEKAAIAEALKKIASGDPRFGEELRSGASELGYLQTPAAYDELIKLLGQSDKTYSLYHPFISARDPAAVATKIVEQVRAGKLLLDDTGAEIFGLLKTAPMLIGKSPVDMPEKESNQLIEADRQARAAAQRDILAEAIAASGSAGKPSIEALWAAFEEQAVHRNPGDPDADGGKARAAVAARQLELSPAHVKRLLDAWSYWGSADFLPLVRREAGPPQNSMEAFIALIGIAPDEARPRVIEEFGKPDCRFFERTYPSSTMLPAIPPVPLPQFDSLLRQKLIEEKGNAFPIIPVICCFGSPALLPDVAEAYESYGRDRVVGNSRTQTWDDGIKSCLFRYWLRSDPKSGEAVLENEITERGKEGGGFLGMLLMPGWNDDFLPVARWAASSNDQLSSEGIYLLEKHGTLADIDSVITALEHQPSNAANMNYPAREAADLLKSTRWHYNAAQQKRLEALAARAPAK